MIRFIISLALLAAGPLLADSSLEGDLPRRGDRPLESVPGVISTYDAFETSDGYRLRTILTRPEGARGELPAVQFIQWLSCDTIEISNRSDGWTRMLRGLVHGGRYAVLRIDKAGVGDSEGPPCSEVDYETELRHHKEAFDYLKNLDGIDPNRIALFGASMGATMAPLVAADHPVAGVAAWGGGAKTWFERLLSFDRNALELGDTAAADINREIAQRAAFHYQYLIRGRTPEQIADADPELGSVWDRIIGADGTLHYGRPLGFHQQAQQQNWPAAWARIEAPVLVLYGEFDWFETESGHRTIERAVNKAHPGMAELHVIPRMDHHFTLFPSARAAFRDENGRPDAEPVLQLLVPWLHRVLSIEDQRASAAQARSLNHSPHTAL